MKRIGILGGTFDPVHNGHVALAAKAMKEFRLEKVVFVPSGIPPHKDPKEVTPKRFRLKMLRLALDRHAKLSMSKLEINRKGYSYAVDTFKKLRKRFGSKCALYYIMGLDSINSILSWKKPLELFKLCEFIIATRPGTKIRTFKRIMKFPPITINNDKISLIELNMNISSTEIREKIKKGKSVSRFVPRSVDEYIKKKGLYK